MELSYFSRISLDESHPGAQEAVSRALGNGVRGEHRFLWQFFPATNGSARDFLFRRFDPTGERRQTQYYCVSQRPAVAPHPAWCVESREYAPALVAGERLAFDLRINPTQARKRDGKSCRDDVVMHAKKGIMAEHGVARWADLPDIHRPALYEIVDVAIRGWLGNASCPGFAARHGFHVLDDLRVDAYQQHRIPRDDGTRIALSTVDLSGTLEVSDLARFVSALRNGVGHGKAFGCGLLLVRRP